MSTSHNNSDDTTKSPRQILIVEDEKPMALALKLKLERLGFCVTSAYDGAQAMQALDSTTFDLILADLMMPTMDGYTLLELLRERGSTTPVIISSNLSQETDIEKAKALGAAGFVVKSNVTIKDIAKKIEETLAALGP